MKALNPNTGQFETIYVKALDSMPVGTEVDFTGNVSDIPAGWEQVDNLIWTNSNPSTAISTTTISNIDISNFDMITIAFRQYRSNDPLTFATFKKDIGLAATLSYSEVGNGFWVLRSRNIEFTSNTSISVQQGYQTVTGATPSASNDVCIPVYIIGHTIGIF